ncbi:trafficking protein particle complex subunit 13 [Planococcus citri]|uniref:trafficking protein particle complex subunit 13 n=1 Tax=Planococcus citri TaxID=170843 RepID=UPI0031F731F4
MEIKEKIEHPLSLKVMRLTRPTLSPPVIVTCETKDLPGHLFNTNLKNDITSVSGGESLAVGQFLLVPQSFGSIYLGETFSCYICVHNDSNDIVPNVVLKADLQTTTQRLLLIDNNSSSVLKPKQTLDEVIHHEVKEIGTHILVCEVTYLNRLSFRKFFKFQVLKPLDVKTKFYTAESDDVYLEAQIQNITNGPICLEKVTLEATDYFKVSDLNKIESKCSVFGNVNVVDKDASRQYLYCLSPQQDSISISKVKSEAISVGILDIVWRSNLGERGHLQTSTLQTMRTDRGDIRLSLSELPNIVFLEKPFKFVCKISNISDREINLSMSLEEMKNLVWCGTSGKLLDTILPFQCTEIQLNLIPLDIGLQEISGIRLKDTVSQQSYKFDNLAEVFVLQR